jgi:hypothetical protein
VTPASARRFVRDLWIFGFVIFILSGGFNLTAGLPLLEKLPCHRVS